MNHNEFAAVAGIEPDKGVPTVKKESRHFAQVGQYIPTVFIAIDANGQGKHYHLPQKLFAIKQFDQREVSRQFHFENPFQTLAFDPQNGDVALFNNGMICFHQWLVERGYCQAEEFISGLSVKMWTLEEIAEAKKNMGGTVHKVDMVGEMVPALSVNVGTIGHVDHGNLQ